MLLASKNIIYLAGAVILLLTISACTSKNSSKTTTTTEPQATTTVTTIEKASAPVASLPSGQYYKKKPIELSSSTPNVKIFYTINNTDPRESTARLYDKPFNLPFATTVKAVSVKVDDAGEIIPETFSDVVSYTYEFTTLEAIAGKFLSFTYKNMPYRLYVPEDYDENESYPLVMFLHGSGERGTDNVIQITGSEGAIVWAAPENQVKHKAFVLAPQGRNVGEGGFGLTRNASNQLDFSRVFEPSPDLLLAYEILQKVMTDYNIDENRVYCTGLSQGGFGTYNLAMLYPDLFAAIVPIAAGGNPEKADLLVDLPIWNFHAADDNIVNVSYSRNIINSIIEAGGNPKYTEYDASHKYGHFSWVPAYQNEEMVEWVFSQVKNK